MAELAHPTGVPVSNEYKGTRRLTHSGLLTEIRGVPRPMANRSGALPSLKCEAPDLAATGPSANMAYRAGGHRTDTTAARSRIAGTSGLRFGGAA